MTIPDGYRFRVPFDDVFPQGCSVMGVEGAKADTTGLPQDAGGTLSGKPVDTVQVTDSSAKGRDTGQVVLMTCDMLPVPSERISGTPFRLVISEGMAAVPYTRDGWDA